jgi:IS6 family transposase
MAPELILCAVRWYLRYSLSLRDVEELLAERGLEVDHTTIWRWVQRYGPELEQRLRRHLKPTNKSWRVDETYIRVKGRWCYLYRAIDSTGATIDYRRSVHGTSRRAARRRVAAAPDLNGRRCGIEVRLEHGLLSITIRSLGASAPPSTPASFRKTTIIQPELRVVARRPAEPSALVRSRREVLQLSKR